MEWFNGRNLRSFWSPILDPGEGWWRKSHIWAHIVGGCVWDAIARFLIFATPGGHVLVDFRHDWWLRLLGVGLWQLTAWEMVQRENWRPELLDPPGPPGTGYPWLSAWWDTLFTVLGAALLESVVALLRTL